MTSCRQWCTERGRHSMRPSRRLLIWLKTPGERGGAENLTVERLRGARAAPGGERSRVRRGVAAAKASTPCWPAMAIPARRSCATTPRRRSTAKRDRKAALRFLCKTVGEPGGEDHHRREWRQQRSDRGLGSTRTLQIEARGKLDTSLMHTQIGHDMQSGETAQTAAFRELIREGIPNSPSVFRSLGRHRNRH